MFESRTRVRVVIVNDDDVTRAGMAALLVGSVRIQLIAALNHDEALARTQLWTATDVVLLDAAGHRRRPDQFPGVAVVEHVRGSVCHRPTITVVTGHYFDDAVRRRMREARADLFYNRAEMATEAALLNAVLHPDTAHQRIPGPFDSESQFRLGVTEQSCVNEAVRYAIRNQLEQRIAERAEPRSRSWLRLREEFNQIARLTPITSDGRRPDRAQDAPSLPQIARFITWATKIKTPPTAEAHGHLRSPSLHPIAGVKPPR